MLSATPFGEQTYSRQLTGAGLLLQAGGEDNIVAAAEMYNEIYPGLGINFTELIDQTTAAKFDDGQSVLAEYSAAGMDWDEIKNSSRTENAIKNMGMSIKEAEAFYNAMEVNAIDEMMNEQLESQWYKDLITSTDPDDQAEAKAWADYWAGAALGFGGARAIKTYQTRDANGDVVGTYSTEAAAKKDMPDGGSVTPDWSISTDAGKDTGTGGTSTTTPSVSVPLNMKQGEVFVKEGKVYEVGPDDTPKEITLVPENLWGEQAINIVKAGEKDNPLYERVAKAQLQDIRDTKDYSPLIKLSPGNPVYDALIDEMPVGGTAEGSEANRMRIDLKGNWVNMPTKGAVVKLPVNSNYDMKVLRVIESKPSDDISSWGDEIRVEDPRDGTEYYIQTGHPLRENKGKFIITPINSSGKSENEIIIDEINDMKRINDMRKKK